MVDITGDINHLLLVVGKSFIPLSEMSHILMPRLHRAILHLTPPEAIALAFVLGAGIGSIMHLIFMFFLISIRRFRGQGRGKRCKERRERRRMRKEARKAAKLTRDGKIVLAEVEGEVLPSYQDGEGDRLVEKA